MSVALPRCAAHRIACAIVAADLRRLGKADALLPPMHDWPETMPIGDKGLELDSLEQLGALSVLAETFNLDDSSLSLAPPRSVGDWVEWIMHEHASGQGHLTVQTSGSTGNSKACRHAAATLIAEAHFLATQLADRRRLVALVPAHHLYGIIWTALLPAAINIPVVTRTIGAPLNLVSGDLVVAVPNQWQTLSRLTRNFANDVVGISSAGPLDNHLAAELVKSGLSRLLDIYGSSETGAIAIRQLPDSGYDLLPRWQLIFNGHDDWQLVDQKGKYFDLPDYIERLGERRLRVIGRRDGAVQVGGHNVWPQRVADILRNIDGVSDVAVRLHADGRLKAFIVPSDGRSPDELTGKIDRMAEDLSTFECPKHLRFGAALPRNSMGKLTDW